jgi:hypothetical protein
MKRLVGILGLAVLLGVLVAAAAHATAVPTCSPQSCGTWQPGPVHVEWNSNDGGNVSSCQDTVSGESPNTTGTEVTCDDGDGPITAVVRVDDTPPSLSAGLDRSPDSNGWYNHPVSLNLLSGSSDALSGIANCQSPSYSGPDDGTAGLSGTCTDVAGNTDSSPAGVTFAYDATPPQVTSGGLDRPPDHNGWYNHPVTLQLQGNDAMSGLSSCTSPLYSGPNGATAQATGTCTDVAGNSAVGGVPLAYDDSAPEVLVAADRPPDHDGWYNHPVSFAFHGDDPASGTASCSSASYGGPDNSKAKVSGTCVDVAGNTGSGTTTFRYDSTRPAPAVLQATPGNHRVDLSWTLPSDATSVLVARALQGSTDPAKLVYSGSGTSFLDKKLDNGKKYVYTVADIDQAGNSNSTTIRAIPTGSSLRPFVGSVISSPPLLTWRKVRHARYYNVQLYIGKTKVLSTWPGQPSLQLKPKWHYKGKTITLVPGHYRWYVWPGFGPRSSHNYGDRIGRSSFRVR